MARLVKYLVLLITVFSQFVFAQVDSTKTEFLVLTKVRPDSTQPNVWRSGDIVIAKPAFVNKWGVEERRVQRYIIVRVNIPFSLADSVFTADSTKGLKRKYKINRPALLSMVRNRDRNTNIVNVNKNQFRNSLRKNRRQARLQRGSIVPDLTQYWVAMRNIMVGATETSVAVDTDGGGDYSTLASAEAGEQKDLVTANEKLTINCSGATADVTAVTFSGWTTDATRLPQIVGDNTTGNLSSDHYRLSVNVSNGGAITIASIMNIDFKNLQIELTANGSYAVAIFATAAATSTISNSIFKRVGGTSTLPIALQYNAGSVTLINSIAYDFTETSGIGFRSSGGGLLSAYNNTAINCTNGFAVNGVSYFLSKNNIAQNCTDGFNGTFDASSDYNLSDIASDAPGANSITATVTFTDATGGDFSLVEGSRGIDEGTDLSGSGVTTAIDGTARPQGSAYDIGAFEFAAPAVSAPTSTVKSSKWLGRW